MRVLLALVFGIGLAVFIIEATVIRAGLESATYVIGAAVVVAAIAWIATRGE